MSNVKDKSKQDELGKQHRALFPSMMKKTKLLILDYDVTRYHSFDLFRFLLQDKEYFSHLQELYNYMIHLRSAPAQLYYYCRMCPCINPYDNFTHMENKIKVSEMEDMMKVAMQDEKMLYTRTAVSDNIGAIFDKPDITGYRLRYTWDKEELWFDDKLEKTYTTDHILTLSMAMAIIDRHGINAIMLSSIELAVMIAYRLKRMGYQEAVTFMVANYMYNYNQETGMFKHMQEVNAFEYTQKHEFGVYDPFTGLKEYLEEAAKYEQERKKHTDSASEHPE